MGKIARQVFRAVDLPGELRETVRQPHLKAVGQFQNLFTVRFKLFPGFILGVIGIVSGWGEQNDFFAVILRGPDHFFPRMACS